MAVTRRPNGRWLARVKHQSRYIGSRVFDTKAEAVAWEQRQLALLSDGVDLKASRLPLSAWFGEYLTSRSTLAQSTLATDRFMLALIPEQYKHLPVNRFHAGTIEELLRLEAERGAATESIRRYRATLSTLFAWLIRQRITDRNPAKGVPLPKGKPRREPRPFTSTELARAYEKWSALNQSYADVALFLARTGLRWSEAVELRVKDFTEDPDPMLIISRARPKSFEVKAPKNGRARRVWLEASVLTYVHDRVDGKNPEELLLPPLHRPTFVSALDWANTAGGRTIHDLRHTCATQWIARGLNLATVSEWLGHSDTRITAHIYVHWLGAEKNREAVEMLNRSAAGHTTGTFSDKEAP